MLDIEGVLADLGLGGGWRAAVLGVLPDLGGLRWSPETVQGWRRRLILQTEPVSIQDLRVVALALEGQSSHAIRTQVGVKTISPDRLATIALAVALRYSSDDAGEGFRLQRGTAGDRLVRAGLPPLRRGPATRVRHRFVALWCDGVSRQQIADELGLSLGWVGRLADEAQLPRWRNAEVSEFLGWSPDNVPQRLRRGTFPPPDGHDAQLRWWWPETVTAWQARAGLTVCPECGARVNRMKQHRVVHQSSRPAEQKVNKQ